MPGFIKPLDGIIQSRYTRTSSETESTPGANGHYDWSTTQETDHGSVKVTVQRKPHSLLYGVLTFPLWVFLFSFNLTLRVAAFFVPVGFVVWAIKLKERLTDLVQAVEAAIKEFVDTKVTPVIERILAAVGVLKVLLQARRDLRQFFQTTVLPGVSQILAIPFNYIIPWALSTPALTYIVPYAAWKSLVDFFGEEEKTMAEVLRDDELAQHGNIVTSLLSCVVPYALFRPLLDFLVPREAVPVYGKSQRDQNGYRDLSAEQSNTMETISAQIGAL